MAEENIKLSLDYGTSAKDTVDISGKLDMLKGAAKAVGGEAFGELVSKSVEVGKSFAAISWAADKTEKDAKLSFGELKQHGKELFDAFSEKNASGMITGIADIASLVPPLAPFALGIKAAGAAAATAWPLIKQWIDQVSKLEETKLANAAGALDKYAKALEKTNSALKESDALTAARAADKAAKEDGGTRAKERGETFTDLIKGREVDALRELVEADAGQLEREEKIESIKADYGEKKKAMTAKAKKAGRSDIWIEVEDMNLQRQAREQMDAVGSGEAQQKISEELIAKAKAGDKEVLARMQKVLPEGSTTREVARMASPEAQDADRAAKRDVADQEQKFKQKQAQDRARAAANDQVQAQIRAAQAGAAEKILARREAEERGPAAQEKAQQEAIQDTRRMGNQIGTAGQAQRTAQGSNLAEPRMQTVPMSATQEQAMQIMAQNQVLSAQQDRINGARFQQMLQDAKEANRIIQANLRSNQSHGGP